MLRSGAVPVPVPSSSAGVSTPRQLQRQQSCKTLPFCAEDTPSLSVRGRAGDRHPVSPPEHSPGSGTPPPTLCWDTQHTRSSPGTAAAAKIRIIESSQRSYLQTLNPRAHTAHPGLSESSVSPYPPPPPAAPPDPASRFGGRRKTQAKPEFPSLTSAAGSPPGCGSHMAAGRSSGCSGCPGLSQSGIRAMPRNAAGSSDPLAAS